MASRLESYLSEARKTIEEGLRKLLKEMGNLALHPQTSYALTSGGKRLRPLLVLLSGEAVGGEREKLLPIALAVELVHTATLIHDDIIDGDFERRGKPSLYAKWKDKAILTGDLLFAKALNLVSDCGFEIIKVLAEASLELCDGEFLDITLGLDKSSEADLMVKVKRKSASLFRASAHCGALIGGGKPDEVKALKSFGENFGIAYQLADDLREIEEGDLKDLKAGRLTLPYLHLYRHGSPALRRLLRESFGSGRLSEKEVEILVKGLREYGSLEYCRRLVKDYLDRALESLQTLRNRPYRELLRAFALRYAWMGEP